MVMPSALAVLRLMTSSTFVDCWTGRSAGFSPLRIRQVSDAGSTVRIRKVFASVADEAAGCGRRAIQQDRGYGMAECQCGKLFAPADHGSRWEIRAIRSAPARSRAMWRRLFDIVFGARMQDMELKARGWGWTLPAGSLRDGFRRAVGLSG